MRFQAYPSYRPSGVEWLGDLPQDWEIKQLRYLSGIQKGRLPTETFPSASTESDLPYLTMEFLRGETDTPSYVAASPNLLCADAGDVLLLWDGSNAGEFIRAKRGVVSSTVARFEPKKIELTYLFYASKAVEPQIKDQTVGMGIPHVAGDELKSRSFPIPPRAEQRAIADFLDHETAKIDTLVAKKRTLIERLKEKRAALILRTVTRGLPPAAARSAGLNPNPKLKPSGIEWFGDVPEHWAVKPLKHSVCFLEGPGIVAADFLDEGVPLLRISGIGGRIATLEDCNYLALDLVRQRWSHFRVRQGDLLISGSASTGFCSEVDEVTVGAVPYTGIIIVRPRRQESEKDYVRWFFLSEQFLVQANLARTGSTIQHFGPSHLSRMVVALPPLPEQRFMADFLDRETAKIDRMVAKIETAIERLQEYRTALITAAVTGKIDVRKAVA